MRASAPAPVAQANRNSSRSLRRSLRSERIGHHQSPQSKQSLGQTRKLPPLLSHRRAGCSELTRSVRTRGRQPTSLAGDLGWPLRRAALLYGDAEAVKDGARVVTYAELAARVGAIAHGLRDLGVPASARVGFLGVNSIAHIECWFAVPMSGRILVDLNFRLAVPELEFIVNDWDIELLIWGSGCQGGVVECRPGRVGGVCWWGGVPGTARDRAQLCGCDSRLIFEGWLPHDPVFVAVRVLVAGAAANQGVAVAHSAFRG